MANKVNDPLLTVALEPIAKWLADPTVTDISVEGSQCVNVQWQEGGIVQVDARWLSDADLITAVEAISRLIDRPITKNDPIFDGRLPDGSRVHIVLEPCYDKGALLIIRKFLKDKMSLEDLIQVGTLDEVGRQILQSIIMLGRNVLISGGTGCGKTTLLNTLCAYIPKDVYVVSVEDAREISIDRKLWISLESKPAFHANSREINLSELVKASLRENPRWIIVGEVRGPEAYDMTRAFTSGHSGMGTIHANSAYDALLALGSLILTAGVNYTPLTVKENVLRAIDIVVQLKQLPDHSRRIMEIIEVVGLDYTKDLNNPPYQVRTLYKFEFSQYDAAGRSQGKFVVQERPSFIEDLRMIPNYETPSFWQEETNA